MTTITPSNGRLCNQIIRNLCVSLIAKKYNLFIGQNKYNDSIELNDSNFLIN